MTDRVEIVEKTVAGGGTFTGVRFYTGFPFEHHAGDDDSSAVTFWGKRDLRKVLRQALDLLDNHYANRPCTENGCRTEGE